MTTPRLSRYIDGQRWYLNPNRHDGQPVYRNVSSIANALPKEGLKFWAANTVAAFAVDNLERWNGLPREDAIGLLKRSPWNTRDRAAAKGTTVHAVIDGMLAGLEYEVEASVEPWIASARAFVDETGPEPEMTETTMYNERHLFAGTFDFLGRLKAFPELGRVLIDWKTGKDVYPDMAAQVVGGYAMGAEYTVDAHDLEAEWRRPDSAAVVHLSASGYQLRPIPMDDRHRRVFLAALEVRKWEAEAPAMGPPLKVRAMAAAKMARSEPPPPAPDPHQERFEAAYNGAELAYLKRSIGMLSAEKRQKLSAHAEELGLPIRAASTMTADQFDQMRGLITLYEMSSE